MNQTTGARDIRTFCSSVSSRLRSFLRKRKVENNFFFLFNALPTSHQTHIWVASSFRSDERNSRVYRRGVVRGIMHDGLEPGSKSAKNAIVKIILS